MSDFTPHRVTIEGGQIFAVSGGAGDQAFLFLHGWPQTHRAWLPIMRRLGGTSRVIAMDLRGCGDSFKPSTGYDVATQATDVIAVLDQLEVENVHLVGHDVGGPVAYATSALHRDRVASLTLVEAPLWGVTSQSVPDLPDLFWHLKFHQETGLAAGLIGANIPAYFDHFYRDFAYNPDAISVADRAEFIRAYSAPGALTASLMHYAVIPQNSALLAGYSEKKLTIPIHALGGETVMGEYVSNAAQLVASTVHGRVIPNCGHWIAEEAEDHLVDLLVSQLSNTNSPAERTSP